MKVRYVAWYEAQAQSIPVGKGRGAAQRPGVRT